MPLDLNCPKCQHVFPVQEARHPVGVQCPDCDAELTAEFRRVPLPPPGESPYELRVSVGRPKNDPAPPPAGKPMPLDDEEERPRGGSMAMVIVVALTALTLTLGGLGVIGYVLFTNLDTADSHSPSPSSNTRGSNSGIGTGTNTNPAKNKKGNPIPGDPFGKGIPGDPFGKGGPGGNPIVVPPVTPPVQKDTFDLTPVKASPPPITAPDVPAAGKTIEMGGKVGAVAVGGGGRYLVMHVHDRGELKLFDASKGEVVATAQVDRGMDIKLTAGVSRAFLYAPSSGTFRVFSFPDLRKEFDTNAPMRGAASVSMGSRTDGPILMASGNEVVLVDVTGNSAREVEGSRGRPGSIIFRYVRATQDGTAFALSASTSPNQGVKLLTVANRRWSVADLARTVPFPGPDGHFYGAGGSLDRSGLPQVTANAGTWLVPSITGESNHIKITPRTMGGGGKAARTLVVGYRSAAENVTRELTGMPEFEGFSLGANLRPNLMLDEHFFMIPEANLLATLTFDRTKLALRQLK